MKSVLKYLKNYKKELILGPFFKLLEAIFELIVPVVMAKIIDIGIGQSDRGYIFKSGIVLVLLAIFGLSSAYVCQFFAAKCAYGFGTELRSALYKKINSFSHAELDRFGTSALTTRITNDTTLVQTGVNMFIRLGIRAPFLIIGAMVMSFMLNFKMALIFVVLVPIIVFVLYLIMSYTVPRYRRNQKKLDELSRKVHENLDGTRVIRAFTRQKEETNDFNEKANNYGDSVVEVQKISSLLSPLSTLIMNIGIAVVIVLGGFKINAGNLSQGELTAFVNYMTQISLALVVLANLIITFTKAIASAKRIQEILECETTLKEGNDEFKNSDGNVPIIEFKNVSFSYPGSSEHSISDISFKIQKGQTVGIIGGTGSGKSTILNLVSHYYDTSEGEILVNGKNIQDYSSESLRNNIGIVPQKSILFNGTIKENLRYRKKDATEDEMIQALKTSQSYDFVMKNHKGLDAPVSQGGSNFSGGQKQRLAIARAIVGKPDIIIFDDSMSALDYATDFELRKAIANDCKNSTVIIVSQRATSLKNADLILVMENGKCTASGTHDLLLETSKTYREIYNSQIENN